MGRPDPAPLRQDNQANLKQKALCGHARGVAAGHEGWTVACVAENNGGLCVWIEDYDVIQKGKVVGFHYQLFGADGVLIEQSSEDSPNLYLHGSSNIIRGVEQALEGKSEGDHIEVEVAPEDGYGHRDEAQKQRISAKYFKHLGKKIRPGMSVPLQTDDGQRWVTVLKVGLKTVDVDANHPLAGQVLRFVIDVASVRDATEDEVSHGHAHGPGGHQH